MEKITSIKQLKLFLEEIGARARKSLSQNFLIDGNIVDKICFAASQGDTALPIFEIGPGPGALTQKFLMDGHFVCAVEKDRLFGEHLSRFDKEGKALQVIVDDALEVNFDEVFNKKGVAVGNLPYHITAPLIEKLCLSKKHFSRAILMVQKEVAERIVAPPGTKQSNILAFIIRYFGKAKILFHVSKECFYPKPKVDSTVIEIDFSVISPEIPYTEYKPFLHTLFNNKRKMIRHAILSVNPALKRDTEALGGIRLDRRAETLSFEEILTLARLCGG